MHFQWLRFATTAVLTSVVFAGGGRAADSPTASDVLRLTLLEFVDGRFDLQVMLYHRDDRFHHGYAVVPGRDNLPHRVDVTPARPFEFVFKNGSRPNITDKLKGTYAYHDEGWRKLYDQYNNGELLHGYTDKVDPLTWDRQQQKLTGVIDVWIMPPDSRKHRPSMAIWGRMFVPIRSILSWNRLCPIGEYDVWHKSP